MKNQNIDLVIEDFGFQPSELNFQKYANSLPYGKIGTSERAAYNERAQVISVSFKEDALKACGILGHKKADHAFSLAWEQGHASGLHDVFYCLQDLANLIRDLK